MNEPITILDLHMMSEICANLTEVRNTGEAGAKEVFMLSIQVFNDMLINYSRNVPIPESTPETP